MQLSNQSETITYYIVKNMRECAYYIFCVFDLRLQSSATPEKVDKHPPTCVIKTFVVIILKASRAYSVNLFN